MSKITIIFGIISIICMIIMIILYVNLNYKISNTLTLDKLKVKDIEIDKSINVNPNLLIKGTFDSNNDKFKDFNKHNLKVFYIKNSKNKSKIPMELHLDELTYMMYSLYGNKFIDNNGINKENSINIRKPNNIKEETEDIIIENDENNDNSTDENNDNSTDENNDNQNNDNSTDESNDNQENFKNIPGYNFFYY